MKFFFYKELLERKLKDLTRKNTGKRREQKEKHCLNCENISSNYDYVTKQKIIKLRITFLLLRFLKKCAACRKLSILSNKYHRGNKYKKKSYIRKVNCKYFMYKSKANKKSKKKSFFSFFSG